MDDEASKWDDYDLSIFLYPRADERALLALPAIALTSKLPIFRHPPRSRARHPGARALMSPQLD